MTELYWNWINTHYQTVDLIGGIMSLDLTAKADDVSVYYDTHDVFIEFYFQGELIEVKQINGDLMNAEEYLERLGFFTEQVQ